MKKMLYKLLGFVASGAFLVALTSVSTASYGGLHQAVEPEELKQFKK